MRKSRAILLGLLLGAAALSHIFFRSDSNTEDKKSDQNSIAEEYAKMPNLSLSRYKEYTYDILGFENGIYEFDADGNLKAYEKRLLSVDGDWLKKIQKTEFSDRETLMERTMMFDGQNRLVREAIFKNKTMTALTKYSYCEEKVVSVTANIDADGEVESYDASIFLNNEEQNELADYSFDSGSVLKNYTYRKRDEKYRTVFSQYGTDEAGEQPSRELLITYNDEKRTSREESYLPIGHLNQYQKNTYNSNNEQICGLRYGHKYNGGPKDFIDEENMILNEGYWADYSSGNKNWEMHYSYDSLKYYKLYRYNILNNPVLYLEYKVENDIPYCYLHTYEYDGAELKREYIYRVFEDDFTFVNRDGTYVIMTFHENSKSIATITVYFADGNIDEQYSFLDEGKMLWHDVYSYEKPQQADNIPYETVIYRGDVEGNLIDTLRSEIL